MPACTQWLLKADDMHNVQLAAASLHHALVLQAHSLALSQDVSLEPKLWTSARRQTSSLRSECPMLASCQLPGPTLHSQAGQLVASCGQHKAAMLLPTQLSKNWWQH